MVCFAVGSVPHLPGLSRDFDYFDFILEWDGMSGMEVVFDCLIVFGRFDIADSFAQYQSGLTQTDYASMTRTTLQCRPAWGHFPFFSRRAVRGHPVTAASY